MDRMLSTFQTTHPEDRHNSLTKPLKSETNLGDHKIEKTSFHLFLKK